MRTSNKEPQVTDREVMEEVALFIELWETAQLRWRMLQKLRWLNVDI